MLANQANALVGAQELRCSPEGKMLEASCDRVRQVSDASTRFPYSRQVSPAEFAEFYSRQVSEEVEELVDEDGMQWVAVVGAGAPVMPRVPEEEVERTSTQAGGRFQTPSLSHHEKLERRYGRPAPEVPALEAQLAEVKALYKQRLQLKKWTKHLQSLDVMDAEGNFVPLEGMFW